MLVDEHTQHREEPNTITVD